jgi:hypothetical protein
MCDGHAKWYQPDKVPPLIMINGSWDMTQHDGVAPRWEP